MTEKCCACSCHGGRDSTVRLFPRAVRHPLTPVFSYMFLLGFLMHIYPRTIS